LVSSDDPDYEVGGDFATACQCEEGAVVKSIKLTGTLIGGAADTFRWILFKSPNALLDSMVPNDLFSNNPSANQMLLRKNTIGFGAGVIPSDAVLRNIRFFVRRKALQRLGQLHEDDNLRLRITNDDASTDFQFRGYGTIMVAEN